MQVLRIAKRYGHKVICLIGSITTRVGDPTWKNKTRPMLNDEDIESNCVKLKSQIDRIIKPDHILDNSEWLNMNLVTFLKDVAPFFSVNQLINLDTFYNRLANQEHLSMLELIYPCLQGYDFAYLNKYYGCNVQLGGLDQLANITQGLQYIDKTNPDADIEALGMVAELLLNANGEKMGKTTEGAIYLDEELTSSYDFWQFFRNVDDSLVKEMFLKFTEKPLIEIEDLLSDYNLAKKILADCVTSMVHGEEKATKARKKSEAIFERNDYSQLELITLSYGLSLDRVLNHIGETESIGEGKRMIQAGGVQVNGSKVLDQNFILDAGEYIIICGKSRFYKIQVNE
jgi:tyrosyl-tRNA synthetase